MKVLQSVSRRQPLSRKLQAVWLLLPALVLAGCKAPTPGAIVPTETLSVPTVTLSAGIISFTPRFTATLIPTVTPTPTITPSVTPTVPTSTPSDTPTITPTALVLGAINYTSPTANLRTGPGQRFPVVQSVKAGTALMVLAMNSSKDWYLVRLTEEGTEGWVSGGLVSAQALEAVTILSTEAYVQLTQAVETVAAGGSGSGNTITAIHPPGVVYKNDVLAYCDNKTNGEPRKSLTVGSTVTIYWSWYAKTADQLKQHIDNAEYDVRVDGQPLNNWRDFLSSVVQTQDGRFYIYWYIPIGTPPPGEHKIDFKLTWKQQITDGFKNFGPGTSSESDAGSCVLTIK
jgi:uncharacterized protein YraI